ncbi:hypothetical protein [Bifidobacterium leontopitheci]|uniref:Uncharacterized protein n=1 Tax=Bifidobacterium leontopitheci TaxID=2650774 RepID=A0A6I1GBL5_9BIFI|nr:hypothetical protein [Bifidobacterium leontopitheci]KAB7788990.1 hypothetical protein F7D09_2047 [Bifidobacterium leontopitheci]
MGKDLYYDSESLKKIAESLKAASSDFSDVAKKIKDNPNPNFGLIYNWLLSDGYASAKQQTVRYANNMAAIFSSLAKKVSRAESTMSQLEQQNVKKINKLKERIDDVNDKFTTHHTSSTGTGSGNSDGSTTIQNTNNYTPSYTPSYAPSVNVSTGGSGGSSSGATSNGYVNAGYATEQTIQAGQSIQDDDVLPGDVDYTESHNDNSDNSNTDDTSSQQTNTGGTTIPPVPLPPNPNTDTGMTDDSGNRIDVDSDGDSQTDYSITMQDGVDLNAEATRQNGQTSLNITPDRTGASQWGNVTEGDKAGDFNIDTNGDGKADSTLHVDKGQKSQISFSEDENGKYVSVDFDHDGDADFSYRVEDDSDASIDDTAAGTDDGTSDDAGQWEGSMVDERFRQPVYGEEARFGDDDQALDDAWAEIAKNDPLGRSAEELRKQFEERDIVSWDDTDSDLGDIVSSGVNPSLRLYTTQPVTPKGGESWIR